jgi:hypothetical protein
LAIRRREGQHEKHEWDDDREESEDGSAEHVRPRGQRPIQQEPAAQEPPDYPVATNRDRDESEKERRDRAEQERRPLHGWQYRSRQRR